MYFIRIQSLVFEFVFGDLEIRIFVSGPTLLGFEKDWPGVMSDLPKGEWIKMGFLVGLVLWPRGGGVPNTPRSKLISKVNGPNHLAAVGAPEQRHN